MKYYVKQTKYKGKTVYHVICPDGRVANNHDHTDKKIAEDHCKTLNVFYGGKK